MPFPFPPPSFPLQLPEVENYQPAGTGESPLATITDWLDIWFDLESGQSVSRTEPKPDGENWVSATRETNTMPQWAGSCWYHLRYLDPTNSDHLVDPKKEAYWGSPDFYIGGAEHAVLHYSMHGSGTVFYTTRECCKTPSLTKNFSTRV